MVAVRAMGEAAGHLVAANAECLGLSASELMCLRLLESDGPQGVGALARFTGLTSGALTGITDRLEEAGYVRRLPHPTDRRRVVVSLLPDHVAVVRMSRPLRVALQGIEAGLSGPVRGLVALFLREAAAALRAEAGRLEAASREAGGPGGATDVALGERQRSRSRSRRPAHPRPPRGQGERTSRVGGRGGG